MVLPPFNEGTGWFHDLQRGGHTVPHSWWRPVVSGKKWDYILLHIILTEGVVLYVIAYSPLYVR